MHNDQSSYSRWSWVIALILALILLWMFLTGKGPSDSCRNAMTETPVATEAMPTEELTVVTEAFSFSASPDEFVSNGDVSSIDWLNDLDALKSLLADSFKVEGNDTSVVLTGSADSEEAKQQKGIDAEAFFGPNITVDNQITVTMVAPTAILPATAKLYFGPGVHRLPADSQITLEPIVTWLNDNLEAKAIISGYHDLTGDLISNQKLAKKRAQSAYNALLNAGISADRIEMRKPVSMADDGDLSEARRVEISVE
jgi:outer membrane protein OmpA-like peptidoglycan-associated protein